MARKAALSTATKNQPKSTLSLGDELFAITTRNYTHPADLLPEAAAKKAAAIRNFAELNSAAIAKLTPVTEAAKPEGKLLTGFFGSARLTVLARAAVLLVVLTSGFMLISYYGDDAIRIEDESGVNALNNEFGQSEKSVSLRVMRRRHKIGEITVGEGSKLRVVKASNGDAFRSEMAFKGNEADFKLKYKGKASVIVNNGPFKAKVRIPQGTGNDVHLRFKELGQLEPVGEPKFSIEVIKGDVQIAEVDDDDDFEQYKAGEKAIFSLSDSESL